MGSRYGTRVAELLRARLIADELYSRLAFTLDTPSALIRELCGCESLCCDYLLQTDRLTAEGLPFAVAWSEAIAQSNLTLNEGDKKLLAQLGEILGASDLETQQSRLRLLSGELEARMVMARGKSESGTRLCTTLGLLTGTALGVLLL